MLPTAAVIRHPKPNYCGSSPMIELGSDRFELGCKERFIVL
jgi:hypothetical protein